MRSVLSAVFVASAMAVAAAQGQQPQTPSGQQPSTGSQQSASAQEKVVISGCVQTTTAAAPSASATGAAQSASRYELTNARMTSGAGGAAGATASTAAGRTGGTASGTTGTGTTGTTEGAGGATSQAGSTISAGGMRYRLEGDEKMLSQHVNHQVEITGTVMRPAAAAGAAAQAMATLKVESVKMVAAKCQ